MCRDMFGGERGVSLNERSRQYGPQARRADPLRGGRDLHDSVNWFLLVSEDAMIARAAWFTSKTLDALVARLLAHQTAVARCVETFLIAPRYHLP